MHGFKKAKWKRAIFDLSASKTPMRAAIIPVEASSKTSAKTRRAAPREYFTGLLMAMPALSKHERAGGRRPDGALVCASVCVCVDVLSREALRASNPQCISIIISDYASLRPQLRRSGWPGYLTFYMLSKRKQKPSRSRSPTLTCVVLHAMAATFLTLYEHVWLGVVQRSLA